MKKDMVKLFFLFNLCLLFVACNQHQTFNREHATSEIDLQKELDSPPSFYDYFSKIEIIPLETSEESLIKKMTESTYYRGNFYILDKPQKKLFVFNKEGRFLHTIDKRGNGPGEYSDIADFQFNRFSGDLELLNPMGGVLRYDSLGQVFKEKIPLPLTVAAIHNFIALSKDTYLFFCEARDGEKMVVYDIRQKKIVSEMYNLPEFLFSNTSYHHSYSPFYVYDGKVHFVQAYNGDVFTLENNSLVPKYLWDFGKQNFDISGLEEKPIEYYIKYGRSTGAKYANIFISYGENSRYYLTEFFFNNKICSLIFDKQTKKSSVFNTFKEGHRCIPSFVDKDAVYCLMRVTSVNIGVNVEALEDANRKIVENLTDDSNPVIIKYIFKK